MTVAAFIERKARQLAYYIKAFWRGDLPYREVNLFFWDTLEEWINMSNRNATPISSQERVFWHLMHQIHFWPQDTLLSDAVLKEELNRCVNFLENGGFCPFDCVGIRP
ncbi:hypothetical protein DRW07_14595 [Alteromonas sediminis]|uniref:Uncharacterized protein n=1 Tax=Alteromonas sediminis TaxID=2259342 RepID=A0A3N5XZ70_9ALTE|nr:hypothetical protein [Alteromonas sediminis]RPJ66030.1 hypothetical protein DRW07_14595 [Alteromonas sediminis]